MLAIKELSKREKEREGERGERERRERGDSQIIIHCCRIFL